MVGYGLNIQPFNTHHDYSKDGCIVDYGTPNAYDQCMRMNPEFNPIPAMAGSIIMLVSAAYID
jgi:hypothetical protein